MRVIAFAGAKGSGKNTAADMVGGLLHGVARGLEVVRFDYYQAAFADRIRAAALALGVPSSALFEHKDQPSALLGGATGRALLVALGEAVRSVSPNFWADALVRHLDELEEGGGSAYRVVAVTDLRRANELDALEAWEAARPGRQLARVWIERPEHDADEVLDRGVRSRCAVIRNAGTPADLWIRCAALAAWARGEAVTATPLEAELADVPRRVPGGCYHCGGATVATPDGTACMYKGCADAAGPGWQ